MSEQTMVPGVLPIRCKNAVSVRRVYDIVDGLNHMNKRYPMEAVIASGPEDLNDEELFYEERWVEVTCVSPGKLRHLLDRMEEVMPMIQKIEGVAHPMEGEEHEDITDGGVATAGALLGEELPL